MTDEILNLILKRIAILYYVPLLRARLLARTVMRKFKPGQKNIRVRLPKGDCSRHHRLIPSGPFWNLYSISPCSLEVGTVSTCPKFLVASLYI